MDTKNVTAITLVYLLGFQTQQTISYLIFLIFLLVSFGIIGGNLLIITLVSYSKTLHCPMYFFLSQLSLLDILLATNILPKMLHTVLVKTTIILLSECITQFYFFSLSECLECLLLTAMSYDRYLAICKPLHYAMLMTHRVCWVMVGFIWSVSILIVLIYTIPMSRLQFCGPNIIDHFFCDLDPILELSCSDTKTVQLKITAVVAVVVIIPFFIIIISYAYIIVTIFKIPSITGRKKAFSTCSSHLTIVSIYFGTLLCSYLVPRRGQSGDISKFLSLLYTAFTPLLNPIVYSLRNKDLKKARVKLFLSLIGNRRIRPWLPC